jgi:hypothetical protein
MNQAKLIVSWNLPRLAADLAAHLELLGESRDNVLDSEEYLEFQPKLRGVRRGWPRDDGSNFLMSGHPDTVPIQPLAR